MEYWNCVKNGQQSDASMDETPDPICSCLPSSIIHINVQLSDVTGVWAFQKSPLEYLLNAAGIANFVRWLTLCS